MCWTEVAVSFPELDLMAPLITAVFERFWHRTGLSGTANTVSESLHQLTHSPPRCLHLTGSAWVLSIGGDVKLLVMMATELELTPVCWQHKSLLERVLIGIKTCTSLHAMAAEIFKVKLDIWEVLRNGLLKRSSTCPFLLQDHENCADESRGRALNQMLPFNQSMRQVDIHICRSSIYLTAASGKLHACSGVLHDFHYPKWLLGKEIKSI